MSPPPTRPAEEVSALRDHLAIERTKLSNERTLLAYVRTALALVITGAGIQQFMEADAWAYVGGGLLVSGAIMLLLGFWRYYRLRTMLARGRLPVGDEA